MDYCKSVKKDPQLLEKLLLTTKSEHTCLKHRCAESVERNTDKVTCRLAENLISSAKY